MNQSDMTVETVGDIDVDSAIDLLFPYLLSQLQKQINDEQQPNSTLPKIQQRSQ